MSVPMALLLSLSLATAFLAALAAVATGASWSTRPEDDLLNGLPGQPDVGFRHYAGYVGVSLGSGKALFYWCSSTGRVRRRCCRSRAPSARDAHRGRRPVKCGGAWKAEGGEQHFLKHNDAGSCIQDSIVMLSVSKKASGMADSSDVVSDSFGVQYCGVELCQLKTVDLFFSLPFSTFSIVLYLEARSIMEGLAPINLIAEDNFHVLPLMELKM
ncbi:hypothetical protein GUJ93_ZPchr0003g17535 [Zizania palustris]|uniref:Uncharacterized protein n=1 Tax=Zizania palustris TaxID=103762 RepID=A0A8J5SES4_ZIZPA|nr:hypothetical protein GUJ93_ZPchr0003g17535 [Zizania palustris]